MNDAHGIGLLRILALGVGGGGGSVLSRLDSRLFPFARLAVVDTDAQAMADCPLPRLRIGDAVTHGWSSGSQVDRGRLCAEQARDELRSLTQGYDLVFVVVGLGRGTGSGAAPVVAAAARESGACVVGIGVKPFALEGRQRADAALDAEDELGRHADAVMLLANHRLQGGTLEGGFAEMDVAVAAALQAVVDVVQANGLMRVDWSTVRDILRGRVVIGRGTASGDGRVVKAAREAIRLPFLDLPGALPQPSRLVLQVSGGADLSLHEVAEAMEAFPQADVQLGVLADPAAGEAVTVALVAQLPSEMRGRLPVPELGYAEPLPPSAFPF